MCERRDSVKAVKEAADSLTRACTHLCGDDIGKALRRAWNDTVGEPVPEDMTDKLKGLK